MKRLFLTVMVILIMPPWMHSQMLGPWDMDMMQMARFGVYLMEEDLFDARIVMMHKDHLELTAQQEKKIELRMLKLEENSLRLKAEAKIGELRLTAQLKAENVDRKKVKTLMKKISDMRTELMVLYMNYLLDIKELLTPAQIEKLKVLRERFKKEFKKHHSKRFRTRTKEE